MEKKHRSKAIRKKVFAKSRRHSRRRHSCVSSRFHPGLPLPSAPRGEGVFVKRLPSGEIVVFRETPRQRLQRLQRILQAYKINPQQVNIVIREEAEKLVSRTRGIFRFVCVQVRKLLVAAKLRQKAQLEAEEKTEKVTKLHFAFSIFTTRSPPTQNLLDHIDFCASTVWRLPSVPRVQRAPTFAPPQVA